MGMKWPSGVSTHGIRLKIFALDGLVENSTFFSQNPEIVVFLVRICLILKPRGGVPARGVSWP